MSSSPLCHHSLFVFFIFRNDITASVMYYETKVKDMYMLDKVKDVYTQGEAKHMNA